MEHLQGGTIALEHRYDVSAPVATLPHMTTYEGVQDPFGHPIFIKVFHADGAPLPNTVLERLFEHIDTLSTLRHQTLLRILDHGELEPGQPFLVAEGAHTETLTQVLEKQGTLSPRETAALLLRIAQGLDALHEQGIAHGGVTTQWVYMPNHDPARAILDHTQMGLTLEEMAQIDGALLDIEGLRALPPEMFRSETQSFTPSGDVWALGAIAHTCLVGIHPYFQDSTDPSDDILRAKQTPPRALSELGVDPTVSDVVDQALALDPYERFSSAGDFARAFALAVEPQPTPQRQAPSRPPEATTRAPKPLASPEVLPEPTRSGTIAGFALLLLLVTNLAWFGYALSGDLNTPETSTVTAMDGAAQNPLPQVTSSVRFP